MRDELGHPDRDDPHGRRRALIGALALVTPVAFVVAGARPAHADGAFPDAQTVLLPPDRPQQIILAANFGLVFSEDDGGHWQYSCESQATTNGRLYALGAAPDDRIFALSDFGVAMSTDLGCAWRLGAGPFEGGLVLDYFADPTDANHVLAVAEPPGLAGVMPAQLFESRDGGLGYPTILHPGLTGGGISSVEIARTDPRILYLALYEATPGETVTHPRLARSADGGATWETIDLEPMLGASRVTIAAVDANDANRIYLRVSGTGSDGRSVDSIAVSADGGATFARTLNLSGGKLMTFIARTNGTVLATGLLGATVVGYRSLDAGATFSSWSSGLHPRGFGERGATLFAATDESADKFALASSDDNGDTWTPRLRYAEVEAIRSCTQKACVDDCWQKVTIGLWPPPVCGPAADPGATTDAGTTGGGGAGGGGGCATAGSPGAAGGVTLAVVLFAIVVPFRHPRRRRPAGGYRWRTAVVASIAALAAPNAAHAYVRMKTAAGVPEALPSSCLALEVHLEDFPGVQPDAVRDAVTAAARAWSAESNPCTSLTFALSFATGAGPAARDDGVNVIGTRADGWCPDGTDAATAVNLDAGGPTCNAASATAATTVFAASDGRIIGGDTQLNTLAFDWAVLDAEGNPAGAQDLQSVLTHEIGHLIGLDHPCWSGIGDHALDDAGNEVPDCYQPAAALRADTMYPTIDPGDVSHRVLSPEAMRAVCEIYPAGQPARCPSASGRSGCAVARDTPPSPLAIIAALVFAAALVVRVSRPPRRGRSLR